MAEGTDAEASVAVPSAQNSPVPQAQATLEQLLEVGAAADFQTRLLELCSDAVLRLDRKGRVAGANSSAERLLAYGGGELKGRAIKELVVRGATTMLKRLEEPRQLQFRRKDGSAVTAGAIVSQVPDGYVCVIRDLTELESMRSQMERAREEYEQLVNNVTDIIFTIDKDGTFRFVNNQFGKQLGHKIEETRSLIQLIHPEDVQKATRALTDAQLSGRGFTDLEFRLSGKRGAWVYYSANGLPIKEGGSVTGFRGTLRDITLRKVAEDKVEKKRQDLERKAKELAATDRLTSEIIGNVSHDLKTPLTSIQGYSSLLAAGRLGQLNQEQIEAARIIQRQCLHLTRIITDLLDLSKLEARALPFNMRPALLSGLEERCSCRHLAEQKGLTMIWNTPDTIGQVNIDPDRVAQVLINLVSNAIKFTDRGSVTVYAFPRDKEFVQVDVIDTGMGIPEEEHERIFWRFHQVKKAGVKKEGTGLGLAIAKQIIEQHSGNIWVDKSTKPGKGSKICFTLPRLSRSQTVAVQQDSTSA